MISVAFSCVSVSYRYFVNDCVIFNAHDKTASEFDEEYEQSVMLEAVI